MSQTKHSAAAGLAVIILTYNEESNLPQALRSVCGWAEQVIVLDSFSTDRTVEIAEGFGCEVYRHPFEDYAKQRNHALTLPIRHEWLFFLDADEWLPGDLKAEIASLIASRPAQNGFYVKMRFIWMARWIRRGYYPSWILRLVRCGQVRCEDRPVNEHLIVDGVTGRLQNDFVHEDRKGIGDWVAKHNAYAAREARELLRQRTAEYRELDGRLFGSPPQRNRWIRQRIWERMPPLLRPFLYFLYRYVVRLGFLDGRAGLVYHTLHGLWYPLLISCKYLELIASRSSAGADRDER
jgi:glycosyltransferase involved in cell wall biosynthesis